MRRSIRCAVVSAALALPAMRGATATAQSRGAGTATISGTVISGETSARPLRRATVSLISPDLHIPLSTVTDDGGRFVFTDVAAGVYSVSASKPAYVGSFYGSTRPGRGPAIPVTVHDGEHVGGITLTLTRGGVITGQLRLPGGRPAEGMTVIVAGVENLGGRRRLRLEGGHAKTDDRGEYRVYGLAPGDYIVQAQPSGVLSGAPSGASDAIQTTSAEVSWAQAVAQAARAGAAATTPPQPERGHRVNYAPVFFPGTSDAGQAATITVNAGEERGGVDFALALGGTAKVSGMVVGPDGAPVPRADVRLVSSSNAELNVAAMLSPRPATRSGADGSFVVPAVAPGRYRVVVQAASASSVAGRPPETLWAQQDLMVDGDEISGLTLSMQPGMTVSGRLAFDVSTHSTPPAGILARARVTLTPTSSGIAPVVAAVTAAAAAVSAGVAADGSFTVGGLTPDTYRVTITMPGLRTAPDSATERWTLASVRQGDRDLLDANLIVAPGENIGDLVATITDRSTALTGTLTDQSGRAATGYPIVVFSTDRRDWSSVSRRVAVVRPSTDGTFRVAGLPAGAYYLGAVVDLDPSDLDDPGFFEALTHAALMVTLTDGVKTVRDLRLASGR